MNKELLMGKLFSCFLLQPNFCLIFLWLERSEESKRWLHVSFIHSITSFCFISLLPLAICTTLHVVLMDFIERNSSVGSAQLFILLLGSRACFFRNKIDIEVISFLLYCFRLFLHTILHPFTSSSLQWGGNNFA